jgi:site-specific DNA recombinase
MHAAAKATTDPVRAAVYTRISSDDDTRTKGMGVARQEEACRALVASRGWEVAEVYVDNNLSASKQTKDRRSMDMAYIRGARPAFDRLLEDLESGLIDRVVALAQDRLCRRPDELEAITRRMRAAGLRCIDTVTDGEVNIGTTTGRTLARVKGAMDMAYSEYISDKVKEKKSELARDGMPSGGGTRAYGYARDGVTIDRAEAKIVREAARRILKGDTLYAIAMDLNGRGVPTVTGRMWTQHTLRGILTSHRVAGIRAHHGEEVGQAAWPGILDRATWESVSAVLAAATPRRHGGVVPRLLTGVLVCGRCGTTMYAGTNNRKRAYACRRSDGMDGCGKLAVVAEPVEEIVVEAVLRTLDTPALARAVKQVPRGVTVDVDALEGRLVELAELWADGELTKAAYLAAKRRIDDQLAAGRAQLTASAASVNAATPYVGKPGLLRSRWPRLTDEQRREVIAAVVDQITIAPVEVRGRHTFDPTRISVTWRA